MTKSLSTISAPQRDLLWRAAQHMYGWCYVSRFRGQTQVAKALDRRGLVKFVPCGDPAESYVFITDTGRAEVERRWPVSPFVLRTYDHQPGGWTPREGVPA